MPRSSAKALFRADFIDLVEDACTVLAVESLDIEDSDDSIRDAVTDSDTDTEDLKDNKVDWTLLEDLVDIYDFVFGPRYMLSRQISAGRHSDNILDNLLDSFSETHFRAFFRMTKASFGALVNLLHPLWEEHALGSAESSEGRRGGRGKPVSHQIATGLYVLGGQGGGRERIRGTLNIGYGTVNTYLWRLLKVLTSLTSRYIRWPSLIARRESQALRLARADSGEGPICDKVFHRCIGFLDGSIIVLQTKPLIDPEAYFSRKKNYGFNLQAICDWDGRFIHASMGYTASTHDSTAFKNSGIYKNQTFFFQPEEYLLADKGYALERHIIVSFKEPLSRLPTNSDFNYQLSIPRVKIEHAFGMLKARFPTLFNLPLRIDEDQIHGHQRVFQWVMGCLVLHNILLGFHEDESWLEEDTGNEDSHENANAMPVQDSNQDRRAGEIRRNYLRDQLSLIL